MINILIAEDNPELRTLIKVYLDRAGYNVYEAENGEEALSILEKHNISLIVTDIVMPGMDGYKLVGELRDAGINIPVIMMSVKDKLDDKREGFRLGIDDYMTKPVDAEELVMRVHALLRRYNLLQEQVMRIGNCTIDSLTLLVKMNDMCVELRRKEFLLLQKLLSNPNRIFTRQTLMDDIWGYESESDPRTVDTHIKRLREKLADFDAFEIVTVRGLGYKAVISE